MMSVSVCGGLCVYNEYVCLGGEAEAAASTQRNVEGLPFLPF